MTRREIYNASLVAYWVGAIWAIFIEPFTFITLAGAFVMICILTKKTFLRIPRRLKLGSFKKFFLIITHALGGVLLACGAIFYQESASILVALFGIIISQSFSYVYEDDLIDEPFF